MALTKKTEFWRKRCCFNEVSCRKKRDDAVNEGSNERRTEKKAESNEAMQEKILRRNK